MNEGFLNVSFAVISAVIGACVLLLMYIIRMLKHEDNQTNDTNTAGNSAPNKRTNVSKLLTSQNQQHHQHEQQQNSAAKASGAGAGAGAASGSGSKKQKTGGNQDPKWAQGRSSDKHNYTHPWLLTSLKGHTGQVFDMDFSSNGKYLASCAEEPDPGGHTTRALSETIHHHHHHIHNSSDCNKENNNPAAVTATMMMSNSPTDKKQGQGLSRRQRKNRRREDSSPPAETKKKSRAKRKDSQTFSTPLKQFTKLGLNELQLGAFLRSYLLNAEQMLALGYPVESELHPGRAIIFKSPMTAQQHYNPYKASQFDVNAREFVPQTMENTPYIDYSQIKQAWSSSHSSGTSSDSSSEPASLEDSDDNCGTSSDQDSTVKSSGSAVRDVHNSNLITSEERQCVRCGHGFFVASDGEYLTQEHCVYHWGKLQRVFTGPAIYSCCKNVQGSSGCSVGKLHVWNGVGVGFNGPFDSYARTRARKTPPPDGNFGVYALDCEMCYTVGGLELAKVTVIGADGRLVYDCFVKPEHEIVDYNTRFSGITARDLSKRAVTKTLREVQNDLMGFVNADTILIGHGLENDLRALRIMHGTVVDTAVTFPHYNGLPYRRSLKSLTQCYLKREIQCGNAGHNSCEDARACMELMLWRVRKDFRGILEHLQLQQQQQQQQQTQPVLSSFQSPNAIYGTLRQDRSNTIYAQPSQLVPGSPSAVRRTSLISTAGNRSQSAERKIGEGPGGVGSGFIAALSAKLHPSLSPRNSRRHSEDLGPQCSSIAQPPPKIVQRGPGQGFLDTLNAKLAQQHLTNSQGQLKANKIRQIINSKAQPDPTTCHESLMDQIKRGATLKKARSVNDRSAPKIY